MGKDIKKTVTFTIAKKKIKTLRDKPYKGLYTENYKTLLR